MQDISNMQNPFLIGDRVYLRPLEPAQDNHLYSMWLNDEEIRKYFSIYPTSDMRSKDRLENLYKSFSHIIFGVALKSDNTLIGLVGLKDINILNQSADFYIVIGDYSHKDYSTEASRLMLRYGFMELNLNRIQTQEMENNNDGCHADEEAGFKYEGILRETLPRFGKFHNVKVYSLLRREFMENT